MPYHNPIPEKKGRAGGSGVFNAWVQAEKLLQISFVLPTAAAMGWLLGAWADRHFHRSWITVVGIMFGCASGLAYTIKMAIAAERTSDSEIADRKRTRSSSEDQKGTPDDQL